MVDNPQRLHVSQVNYPSENIQLVCILNFFSFCFQATYLCIFSCKIKKLTNIKISLHCVDAYNHLLSQAESDV